MEEGGQGNREERNDKEGRKQFILDRKFWTNKCMSTLKHRIKNHEHCTTRVL